VSKAERTKALAQFLLSTNNSLATDGYEAFDCGDDSLNDALTIISLLFLEELQQCLTAPNSVEAVVRNMNASVLAAVVTGYLFSRREAELTQRRQPIA